MRRRFLLPIALCLPLASLAWAQSADPEPDDQPQALPHFTVSAEQLQRAVAQPPGYAGGGVCAALRAH